MNYRHAYHAGNAADVLKHAVLARLLVHLNRKDTPWRALDVHAGLGVYDLGSEAARKTGEAGAGIGRLEEALAKGAVSPAARSLLAPYLDAIAALRAEDGPLAYPGSPEIARRLARPQDRVQLNELHERDVETLRRHMGRDARVTVTALDARAALKAALPPRERRGLVLIDPPFEAPDSFALALGDLQAALAKWPTGTAMLWYPLKDARDGARLGEGLRDAGCAAKTLRLEMWLRPPAPDGRLFGSGLLVANPPHTLEGEAGLLLPALLTALGGRGSRAQGLAPTPAAGGPSGGGWRVDWAVTEAQALARPPKASEDDDLPDELSPPAGRRPPPSAARLRAAPRGFRNAPRRG